MWSVETKSGVGLEIRRDSSQLGVRRGWLTVLKLYGRCNIPVDRILQRPYNLGEVPSSALP